MKIAKVSIIIPVYNGENYLKQAIESAVNQTYPNCEVLVINDGSYDDGHTEDIALSFGDKIKYFHKQNGGVASALNLGIEKMTGDYFSWLSHDDIYYEDKIERQMQALSQTDNEKTIVYGNYTVQEQETNERFDVRLDKTYKQSDLENGLFAVWMSMITGCSLLIHKSHFAKYGNFNEQLKSTQDYDMWFRLFQKENLFFINQPLLIVRIHKEQGSQTTNDYEEERKELFDYYLRQLNKAQIKKAFGSEYKFYSILLDHFIIARLYANIETVKKRMEKLKQPDEVNSEVKELVNTLQGYFGKKVKEYYIFGSGNNGKKLRERLLLRGIKINGFIDNDEKKWGKIIDGVICESFEKVNKQTTGIIIAVQKYEKIQEQLDKAKFKNYILESLLEPKLIYTGIKREFLEIRS
ncbi:MAG: glycosyltransferase [Lachnospiraceae bacterium]